MQLSRVDPDRAESELILGPAAVPGMPQSQIDTPALLLELDAFERNLQRMQALTAQAGMALRPHAKAHKCPEIALAQLRRGAVGICCQKVSEALPFVQAGVTDIHISNEIAAPAKAALLAAMARQVRISVCVDHPQQVQWLAAAALEHQSELHVLIEIDVGQHRCGVAHADDALHLLRLLADHPQLHFQGLQAYHGGLQHVRSHAERRTAAQRAAAETKRFVDALAAAGTQCATVTGGGSGSVEFDCDSGVYTEVQPGSYALMDNDYGRNEQSEPWRFEQALFVASTVMSVGGEPEGARLVCDAGLKSLAVDSGLPRVWQPDAAGPRIDYTAANDEHGMLASVDPAAAAAMFGHTVWLVPGHVDPTMNLHDQIIGVRRQQVECLWPISARGLSR